ncbi:stage II sporulation protein P [Rummeliibacillus sp. BSL5]
MRRRKQRWKFSLLFLAIFFSLPIIAAKIPVLAEQKPNGKPVIESPVQETKVAYAAKKGLATKVSDKKSKASFDALVYFTHSHEAYAPILRKHQQAVTAYHNTENIQSLGKLFTNHFKQNNIQLDLLDVDTQKVMSQKQMKFYQAYDAVRPYVKKQIEKKDYDLILDIHRDSAKRNLSTITYNGTSYARMAIVIGTKNPSYQANEAYAEKLSKKMADLVPGISRGVIAKKGAGVNGIYNQDLSKQSILVEIGGVDNTEEELNRSVAILARAIEEAFANTNS